MRGLDEQPQEHRAVLGERTHVSVALGDHVLELALHLSGLLGGWFAVIGIGGMKIKFAQKPSPSEGCMLAHLRLLEPGLCGDLGQRESYNEPQVSDRRSLWVKACES